MSPLCFLFFKVLISFLEHFHTKIYLTVERRVPDAFFFWRGPRIQMEAAGKCFGEMQGRGVEAGGGWVEEHLSLCFFFFLCFFLLNLAHVNNG